MKKESNPQPPKPATRTYNMSNEAIKHLNLLGFKAKDKVTGFHGVVTSMSYDLYGCIQASLTPPVDKTDKEVKFGHWFDVSRLKILSKKPVIDVPDFTTDKQLAQGKKGPAEKPWRMG